MKTDSLKKNFFYSISYQLLILFVPLITIPYISRVLGSEGLGEYSFTYSIVYYFMLASMLGFNNYGNRYIAKVRDDKHKLSKSFKEIHTLQLVSTSIMIGLYIIYYIFICNNYKLLSLIQFLYVISCYFDINWFFFGIEKFKITVLRNTFVKIISMIAIFMLVKNESDVWIYTLILSSSTLLSQIMIWPFVGKYIDNVSVNFKDVLKHLIPCIKMFLPVIAVAIYKIMDKTMLGLLSGVNEVGFYENAEKIINVPNGIITAFGTLMLPRMSNIYSKKNDQFANNMIEKSIKAILFLSLPLSFGLIAISHDFSVLFFGQQFEKSGILICLLSSTIIALSWGNVIRTQFMIPKEMDKEYIISAFLGAIINLIMNLIFIPLYGSIGACIGTIAAEYSVTIYQTIKVLQYLPIKHYIKSIVGFTYKTLIMFIIVCLLKKLQFNSITLIIIQSFVGFTLYFAMNTNYIFYELKFSNIIKKMLNKEK